MQARAGWQRKVQYGARSGKDSCMEGDAMRVLLVFVDGVGVGDDAEYNPFVHARIPILRGLLGTIPLARRVALHGPGATLIPLDATLGVDGTPQSGTGQTTLLTGRNAAQLHGAHFGPWVPAKLRPMLRSDSILKRAIDAGYSAAFANAYPEELIQLQDDVTVRLPQFLRAGPPVAAMGAGLFTRNATDLIAGDAVASEITNGGWRDRLGITAAPDITAESAGATLARIASGYHVTLFAHYHTDTVGHDKDLESAVAAIERVDSFLGGVISAMADDCMLVVASDHGNIEDIRTGHTRNPALGLVVGPGHARITEGVDSLMDVVPMILSLLSTPRSDLAT